jgi:adenosylcobyric acid synthase
MILGTCSGAGKSLITTAICRYLYRKGENPIPFKGQNMSNNAWVDKNNGEMAYSQAVQAWAAGAEPISAMNPVLLKPQGDCTSEVIHLGKSVGISKAATYYEEWFVSGWNAIKHGLTELNSVNNFTRLVLEGAGSPVEVNLQHRDLTNLRLANHLKANCVLVADIERGGVFAQIIGTLALLKPNERDLIKGIIINRFRGDIALFDEGRKWIENETKKPVLGIMPWLNEIFPPEDSLDLLERKSIKSNTEIKIVVIRLPSLSNFSDLDPLEAEPSVQLIWIAPGEQLGNPNAVIIPGSKQTLKDLEKIKVSGLGEQIKAFAASGGIVFGICGGLQMLGNELEDPLGLENSLQEKLNYKFSGLRLLSIKTIFERNKTLARRNVIAQWPKKSEVSGFELHHGKSLLNKSLENDLTPLPMFNTPDLGWSSAKKSHLNVAGSYLHGIFENGEWRRLWLNEVRRSSKLKDLPIINYNHSDKREEIIERLTDVLEENINLTPLLSK